MKIVRIEVLIDAGGFGDSAEWKRRYGEICEAITTIEWPPGSGSFTLYDQSGKKRGEGSGVTPIKKACMARLQRYGWKPETRIDVATVKMPRPADATCRVEDKLPSGQRSNSNEGLTPSESLVPTINVRIVKKCAVLVQFARLEGGSVQLASEQRAPLVI